MNAAEELKLLKDITNRLGRRHEEIPRPLVQKVVDSSYNHFHGVPIRDFVPVLVERRAASRLNELAHS